MAASAGAVSLVVFSRAETEESEGDPSKKRQRTESPPQSKSIGESENTQITSSGAADTEVWEVLANHGWVPFDAEICEKLTDAMKAREHVKFSANEWEYCIDIDKMMQINLTTGQHRHVRCRERGDAQTSPDSITGKKITSADVQFFRYEGYLIKDHFFTTQEVAAMKSEIVALKNQYQLSNSSSQEGMHNDQLHRLSYKSLLFRHLLWESDVQEALHALLGGPGELYLDCQLFQKPALVGQGTAWHQDNAYFHESSPLQGCGMWIAIDDADVENGTLHVIPRVHTEAALPHTHDQKSDHMITCREALDERGIAGQEVACNLQAGGVVFFTFNTPHCTKDNRSNQDRTAVAFHFHFPNRTEIWFRVLRMPNVGFDLEVGGVYALHDLISMCDGGSSKIHSLIEHLMDGSFFQKA